MPARELARRLIRTRRAFVLVALAGLVLTLAGSFLATSPQTVGPAMFLPWVALLAFEIGPVAGLAAAVATFGLFLASASGDGLILSTTFVVGRLASFALIGIGVGLAGARLRASEQRSQRLVEGLPLAMYTESESGLTYISPQIEDLLGYPAGAWLSEGLWRKLLHHDDQDRVLEQYAAAVAATAPFECDYRLSGRDGRIVWVRDSSAYVADGGRSYRQGFIVDITQQKENERKLERNATLMGGLINGTVDGIVLTDRDGEIAIANEPLIRFAAELGIPADGPIHERLLGLADRMTEPERYADRMRKLGAAPDTERFDEFELRETGRSFQGFTKALISDGDFLGRVWTLREVTRERQIDRMKDALVATVSHELRTPLTSIIGYLELLGTGDEPLGEDDAKYAEIAQRNASRLQQMVDDLLFLARVDAGALSLEIATIDLVEAA